MAPEIFSDIEWTSFHCSFNLLIAPRTQKGVHALHIGFPAWEQQQRVFNFLEASFAPLDYFLDPHLLFSPWQSSFQEVNK